MDFADWTKAIVYKSAFALITKPVGHLRIKPSFSTKARFNFSLHTAKADLEGGFLSLTISVQPSSSPIKITTPSVIFEQYSNSDKSSCYIRNKWKIFSI